MQIPSVKIELKRVQIGQRGINLWGEELCIHWILKYPFGSLRGHICHKDGQLQLHVGVFSIVKLLTEKIT